MGSKARSEVKRCSVRGVSKVNWGFLVWGCIGFLGKVKNEREAGFMELNVGQSGAQGSKVS